MTTLRRGWPLIPITCLLLAAAVGMGRQQPPAVAAPALPMPAAPAGHLTVAGPVPQAVQADERAALPSPAAAPEKPAAATIDQLMDQLERLRAQKAELDRQEKATIEKLQEAVAKQKDRLTKLGVVEPAPAPALVPPLGGVSVGPTIVPPADLAFPPSPGGPERTPAPRK